MINTSEAAGGWSIQTAIFTIMMRASFSILFARASTSAVSPPTTSSHWRPARRRRLGDQCPRRGERQSTLDIRNARVLINACGPYADAQNAPGETTDYRHR